MVKPPPAWPASHAQRRLWLLDRIEPGSAVYNMPAAVLLEGPLDEHTFAAAFERLGLRHDALRTSFALEGDDLVQVVADEPPALEYVDLRGEADPAARAAALVREDAYRPFDLHGSLVRAMLLRLSGERAVFSCNTHHAVSDQWSQELLLADLLRLYASEDEPAPVRQYGEFAQRQNARLSGGELQASRDYWRAQLGGELAPLQLPIDFPRPAELSHDGGNHAVTLDAAVAASLERLCRAQRTTPFQLLTALAKALLYRWSGQREIVVGTPIAGRDHVEFAQTVGNFVNTLVLRDEVEGSRSFLDLLAQVKETTEAAYEHAAYPFDLVVGELELEPDLSRSPLFDVAVIYQADTGATKAGALRVEPFEFGYASAKFDLSFYFGIGKRGLRVVLNYNTSLFRPATIERMAAQLATLAAAVAATPEAALDSLEMLAPEERTQLLDGFNATAATYPDATIVELFEDQARRNGARTALTTARGDVTYEALNARANAIAHALREQHGVEPGERVAVLVEPSADAIATLLGVLKAGAAYVPLDPIYPPERLAFILADSAPRVLVTEAARLDRAWNVPAVDVTALRGFEENPAALGRPADPAYIIYTSGSTGSPKGCCVEQRSVVCLLRNARLPFAFGEGDTWVLAHSLCFDFSVWEMYGALLYGGRLVIAEREVVRDPERFHALVKEQRVSVLNQTPAAFTSFIACEARAARHDLDAHLRYVVFGGDRLEPAHLRPWAGWYPLEGIALVNMFGITETTVHVTFGRLAEVDVFAEGGRSPIGVPLPQTRVYVLNAARRLQPIGVAGELYVGGTGVCREYLGRPELTAERFVENPYRPGERLFRSGDLGRWSADGTLDHLGRNDSQVQVRGFRVELGEIAGRLLAHPRVRQAHVVARETAEGTRQLVAYLVAEGTVELDELRAHLRERLPEYMLPAHVVRLDTLPLTANNKIDERRLPSPEPARLAAAPRPPRDGLESALVAIWSRVLGVAVTSVDESYFNLGGDSIKVIRLVNEIATQLGVRVAVKDVFLGPTVARLATVVRRGGDRVARARANELLEERRRVIAADPALAPLIARSECETYLPLSDIEQGLLYHSQLDPASAVYHEQFVFELDDPSFDAALFEETLRLLVDEHAIMRTSFHLGAESAQLVWRTVAMDFAVIDRSGEERARDAAFFEEQLAADLRCPFDPARPGLWRMRVVDLGGTIAILWSLHHAIIDGWSNALFLSELTQTYLRRKGEPGFRPEPLRASYGDFVADQLLVASSEETAHFWTAYLAEYEKTPLPLGKVPAADRAAATRRKSVRRFDAALSAAALALAREAGVSIRELYMAAFTAWLELVTGSREPLFGVVGHGRPAVEDGDRIVGCCVNSIPIRAAAAAEATPRERLAEIHRALDAVRPHERLSTHRIARLAGASANEGNPLYDVLFNFVDFHVLERLDAGLIAGSRVLYAAENTNSQIDFSISGTFGEYSLSLYYLDTVYDDAEADRLCDYFARLLEIFVGAPDAPLDRRALLAGEYDALLARSTGPRTAYPRDTSVAALFDEQARLHGDRPALAFPGGSLTYAELRARADGLAHGLRERHGVGSGDCVAMALPRSELAVIAMLGVLKAGAAYVPLDPEFPAARRDHIVAECGARVVLSAADVDALAQPFGGHSLPAVAVNGDGGDLAYVIYTSGSTGVPKGSRIEQRAIVRLVRDTNYVTITPHDRIAQAGSIAFDACTFEVWGALLNGACVTLVESATLADPERFAATLREQRISVLFLTTSLFNQFAEADPAMFAGLRVLLTGGENASPAHFAAVRAAAPALDLLHVYGPTENTTFSTFYRVHEPPREAVPIGAAIANSSVYLLDAALRPVPLGVPGEICTGGDGVARGYLGEVNAAGRAFEDDPFIPGGRLYRTGDLGRRLPDGSIQFLGRIDGQVKVRGFRVEPGEVEAALHRHPAIVEAIVLPHRTAVGTIDLVAYYTLRAPLDETALRAHLAGALPAHMIPAHLIALETMPLSLTGKIDRRKLPPPGERAASSELEGAAPRDERERLLVEIWRALLGASQASIHDNYFALGGDSIKLIQLSSRLRQAGWRLDMRALFEHPTIAELAPTLQPLARSSRREEERAPAPLTPVQRWFFETHDGERNRFNMSLRLRAAKRIDEGRLRTALDRIAAQHAALCLRFVEQDGVLAQIVAGPGAVPFEIVNEETAASLQGGLDIRGGPLFRAALLRGAEADDVLLVVHHLVADALSCRVLIEDLERAYRGEPLDEATDSFTHWSRALERFAQSPACEAEAAYWRGGAGVRRALLPDRPEGTNRYGDCRSFEIRFDEEETALLLRRKPAELAPPSLFLTALGRVLDGAKEPVAVTLEGHGRESLGEELDVARTVGWFTSLFPFQIELHGADGRAQVEHVDEALRAVPRNGLTYGVARYLTSPQAAPLCALPSIAFNYLGEFGAGSAAFFTLLGEAPGAPIDPALERPNVLDLVGLVLDRTLRFSFTYSSAQFDEVTIERLAEAYRRELLALGAALVAVEPVSRASVKTTFADVSQDELAAFLGRLS